MKNASTLKLIGIAFLVIIGLIFGVKLIGGLAVGLIGLVLKLAIPAAIVLGILYVIYRVTGGDKSLPRPQKRLP
jgi:hypothetical protein